MTLAASGVTFPFTLSDLAARLKSSEGSRNQLIAAIADRANTVGAVTGDGGAVTQATNRSTGVTLNKKTGKITLNNTSLAAGAAATFTVTNDKVGINDVIVLSKRSGFTNVSTVLNVSAVANGSFDITVVNGHASTAEVGTGIVNFVVIKGAAN